MHFLMIVIGVGLAWWMRCQWSEPAGDLSTRWQWAVRQFVFPPLLLLMTAIAILCMGPSGTMAGHWVGWSSYGLAIAALGLAIVLGIKLAWDSYQTLHHLRQHPLIEVNGNPARLLKIQELYSAQAGFWHSELLVSQGLIETLDAEHLQAVMVHEAAHAYYRDTFWFFWLGWLRRLSCWMPHTEDLWQELLMLRELRADQQAAQQVDPLVLAESLLLVVSGPLLQAEVCAAFSWAASRDRLTERIDSLLAESPQSWQMHWWSLNWLLLAFLPLLLIPFHAG